MGQECTAISLAHGIMGRRFPDGGLLRSEIQKMSPSTTGRCSRSAANQWERGTATRKPFTQTYRRGRKNRKLFATRVPIIPWSCCWLLLVACWVDPNCICAQICMSHVLSLVSPSVPASTCCSVWGGSTQQSDTAPWETL